VVTALTRRFKNNFYLFLAALLTLAVFMDAGVFHIGENMRQRAFDYMCSPHLTQTDPDIVIVDVNEASLAALAPDYGRWPWPRQVFGEFVNTWKPHPKAIVFDIRLPMRFKPDSDVYFNDVISATDNVFFPSWPA